MVWRWVLRVSVVGCLVAQGSAQEFAPPRDFSESPAEQGDVQTDRLIVGLEGGSELAKTVQTSVETQGLEAAQRVATAQLTQLARVSLQVDQIASGNNIVVTVDVAAILEDLTRILAGYGVKAAYRLVPLEPTRYDRLELLLEHDERAGNGLRVQLDQIVPPSSLEISGDPTQTRVTVDLDAVLDIAAAQLSEAPEVSFVQREQRLRPH